MANKKYPKGSEWRKWDLQLHCPVDVLENQFNGKDANEKWDKYLSSIEATEIEAVGITNYFCINGYEELLQWRAKGRVPKLKLILPNIEFRISQPNKAGEFINLHVIFSDKIKAEKIRDFLNRLPLLNTTSDGKQQYCSDEGLRVVSYGRALVELSVLTEHLEKDFEPLRDYLIVGVPRGYGSFRPDGNEDRGVTVAIEIDKAAHAFFGKEGDISHFLNTSRFENAIKKPVISASDAHRLELIESRFSWIKADPTFEGLKQILYEPELRIKIQQDNPSENETFSRIEKCTINLPGNLKIHVAESEKQTDFCLQGKYGLEFSNNLTCIIGGRGSGKSTIVHLLYNAWGNKEAGKLHAINSPIINLDLSPEPLTKVENLTDVEIPEDTEFFLQNEIEKFARDVDEMSALVRHRLMRLSSLDGKKNLKELQNEWNASSKTINGLVEAYDSISDTDRKIEGLKKQIDTLKKQTAVIKSNEYKNFQKEIEETSDKISAFRRYKTEHSSLIKGIDALSSTASNLKWDTGQGASDVKALVDSLRDYKEKLNADFSKAEKAFDKNKYPDKLSTKKVDLKKYLGKKGLSPENIEELADASEQVKTLEDEIHTLEENAEPYKEIYKNRKTILEDQEKKYTAYHDRFFAVAGKLEDELGGLPFFDKKVTFVPKVNIEPLQVSAAEFVKKNSNSKVTLQADNIQNVLFGDGEISEYLSDKEKIRGVVNGETDKTMLHRQVLQELVNDPVFLERLYLRIWKNYYDIGNIQVQTKLGEKLLQNTSFGERCGIVVSIVLVAGTNPIIVDQPEDNLDGKFISNVLVPLIRRQKHNRQIVLVTRDANLVIGGDAELIHILESDEKKTEVLPSSIENTDRREGYIWILDGGKEAFQKREQKYNFS